MFYLVNLIVLFRSELPSQASFVEFVRPDVERETFEDERDWFRSENLQDSSQEHHKHVRSKQTNYKTKQNKNMSI